MKTLADLKRDMKDYEWSLLRNSWHDATLLRVPDFQAAYRRIGRIQTERFTLLTLKDGLESESWLDFPKAKNLTIEKNDLGFKVTFLTPGEPAHSKNNQSNQPSKDHFMVYQLRKIN